MLTSRSTSEMSFPAKSVTAVSGCPLGGGGVEPRTESIGFSKEPDWCCSKTASGTGVDDILSLDSRLVMSEMHEHSNFFTLSSTAVLRVVSISFMVRRTDN